MIASLRFPSRDSCDRVDPGTLVVGSAVREGVRHVDDMSVHRFGTAIIAGVKEASDAAHEKPSSLVHWVPVKTLERVGDFNRKSSRLLLLQFIYRPSRLFLLLD